MVNRAEYMSTYYEVSWGNHYTARLEVGFHDDNTVCDRLMNQKTY